jgi:DNA-binding NtrC family response regulator
MAGTSSRRDAPAGRWRLRKEPAQLPSEQWAGSEQAPRVLIECEDTSMIWALERLLGEAGYEVAACVGPSDEATCALAITGHCELQAGADVIVNHLGCDADLGGEIVHATHAAYPGTPVIVSARSRVAADALAADGTVAVREPWRSDDLLAAIDQLVRQES